MVREYLEKTKEELLEKKFTLADKLTAVQNHYKENTKMIQLLEETDDPTYDSFTPREVNTYNREKVKELKEEQKSIEDEIKVLHDELAEFDCKIDELTSVIRVCKNDASAVTTEMPAADAKSKMFILETVEAERQRIAREIHDSTVQSLTSLLHKSELCMKLIDLDPIRCRLELSSNSKILKDVINDMRSLIYNLRPMSFDDIGFDITVERALDKFKLANNIRCNYKVEGEPYDIKSIVSLTLLRIIQESCSNAVKHGNASLVDVTLSFEEGQLTLVIEDDGDGFDVSQMPDTTRDDNSGFGLSMMKERVDLLSGLLEIVSSVGNGCKIKIVVPVNVEEDI